MTALDYFESNYWRIDDLPNRILEAFREPEEDIDRCVDDLALLFHGNRISFGAAVLVLDLCWFDHINRDALLALFEERYNFFSGLQNHERCQFHYFHLRKYKWLPLWYRYT